MWTFIIGLFVGGFLGLLIGGLACAASKADDQPKPPGLPGRPDDDQHP